MEVTVEQRAPVVRCYKCGSSHVSALCHHCWRPGCAKHVLPSPQWAEKLSGREGGGPGLQNVRARHCGDCAHVRAGTAGTTSRWLAVGVAGTGLAAIGLIVVWLSLIAGLIFLLVGGISAAYAYLRVRRGAVQVRVSMPVPLYPKVADVRLIEQLRGEITLGSHGGDYQTAPGTGRGQGQHGPHLRSGPTATGCGVGASACMTRTPRCDSAPGGSCFMASSASRLESRSVTRSWCSMATPADYPVFRAEDPPSSSRWNFARHYELRAEPDISSGPRLDHPFDRPRVGPPRS